MFKFQESSDTIKFVAKLLLISFFLVMLPGFIATLAIIWLLCFALFVTFMRGSHNNGIQGFVIRYLTQQGLQKGFNQGEICKRGMLVTGIFLVFVPLIAIGMK